MEWASIFLQRDGTYECQLYCNHPIQVYGNISNLPTEIINKLIEAVYNDVKRTNHENKIKRLKEARKTVEQLSKELEGEQQ